MIIIGIAGGTGSGKTTVVRKIVESLSKDEVVILPLDSYYKDSSHVPVESVRTLTLTIRMHSTGNCFHSTSRCCVAEKRSNSRFILS